MSTQHLRKGREARKRRHQSALERMKNYVYGRSRAKRVRGVDKDQWASEHYAAVITMENLP